MAFERRSYSGVAISTTLSSSIIAGDTSLSIVAFTGWPTGGAGPFFLVIDRGTASEEVVKIATRSSGSLTVAAFGRGADGTAATSHPAGATVDHCFTATDADEANAHYANTQADPHPMYLLPAEATALYVASAGTQAFGRSLLTAADAAAARALIGASLLTATVATLQTTASTSYTDLATAGPTVTLTTGTRALVTVSGLVQNDPSVSAFMGFAVSGATTIAAADTKALVVGGNFDGRVTVGASRTFLVTLTAGSNVFTAKYRMSGGTGTYSNRDIIVQAI